MSARIRRRVEGADRWLQERVVRSMSTSIAHESAVELATAYRSRRISPVEVTQAALDRIAAHGGTLNAFTLVGTEAALTAARESEERWTRGEPLGPIDGVPVTIKNLVATRGWPTPADPNADADAAPWEEDAPAVSRLREQGAVFVGQTRTTQIGWEDVSDISLDDIARNPWNPELRAGGSSGGAAAAVAAAMCTVGIATDGGGSIRMPASLCGVFGFKPTFGRIPFYPPSTIGTLAHVGPITRTVSDAALLMNVLARPDPRDWHALPPDGCDYLDGVDRGVEGLRIAYSANLGFARVENEVAQIVANAAQAFTRLGATVEPADPGFENPSALYYDALANEALRTGDRGVSPRRPKEDADGGAPLTIADYLAAVDARTALGMHMNQFHQTYDLLLTPTVPTVAFPVGVNHPPGWNLDDGVDWATLTIPFNCTRQPAGTVPCGFTKEGLPVGVQIIGPLNADALVLRACRAYEVANPTTNKRPLYGPREPR